MNLSKLPLWIGLAAIFTPGALCAQEKTGGVFEYLQKEPMSLFDAGMKSLRRQAIDTAAYMSSRPSLDATARVIYSPTVRTIEISLDIETAEIADIAAARQKCIDLRLQSILKMFRIGYSSTANGLSVTERIQNRLGAQFAHEPNGSFHEFMALGKRLSPITYYAVKLSTKAEPVTSVTCRALVTDSMKRN